MVGHRVQPRRRARHLTRWVQTWRLMGRLARRDIRAHRGRSILVMIMVGAPVPVLTRRDD